MKKNKNYPLEIYQKLVKSYPEAKCSLNFSNNYQLMIAVILSAQCTDKIVNRVTPLLFSSYPQIEQLAAAQLDQVEKIIKPIGLHHAKAKNIIASCKIIIEKHNSKIPASMTELLTLPGVGRKTANVILGEGFNVSTGIVVDTHVARIANRLNLSKEKNPQKIENDLIKIFPVKYWKQLSHLFIQHGRDCCKARIPICIKCSLFNICPSKKNN